MDKKTLKLNRGLHRQRLIEEGYYMRFKTKYIPNRKIYNRKLKHNNEQ